MFSVDDFILLAVFLQFYSEVNSFINSSWKIAVFFIGGLLSQTLSASRYFSPCALKWYVEPASESL